MIIVFIVFILLSGLILFNKKEQKEDILPFVIVSVISIIGMILYELTSTNLDMFIIFELISISLILFFTKKIEFSLQLKFLSYLAIALLTALGSTYIVVAFTLYIVLNVMSLSFMNVNSDKSVKYPIFLFYIYTILTTSKMIDLSSLKIVIVSLVYMYIAALFYKGFKESRKVYFLINLIITFSLYSLSHNAIAEVSMIILFLMYLLLTILEVKISKLTLNNLFSCLITLSLIPLAKSHLILIVVFLFVLAFSNYVKYQRRELVNG
ncbi:hypothetical protein A9Q84_20955 [Halobacteriovorax marinus]|uniref:Uncharacterized protein n=1 Tax=Halobacteriovorax marinus TaxID=97084 RepID=A0A1Y5F6V7_9BACT|nr:hypothetical protein A9Q84_20955 [Halobacteriovorax marinus]